MTSFLHWLIEQKMPPKVRLNFFSDGKCIAYVDGQRFVYWIPIYDVEAIKRIARFKPRTALAKIADMVRKGQAEQLEPKLNEGLGKTLSAGLAATALALGGCKGKDCETSQAPKAPQQHIQAGKTITIDDGREISIPTDADPVEYLQQVNQARAEMGQPPLPIEKTIQYWRR